MGTLKFEKRHVSVEFNGDNYRYADNSGDYETYNREDDEDNSSNEYGPGNKGRVTWKETIPFSEYSRATGFSIEDLSEEYGAQCIENVDGTVTINEE